MNDQTWRRGIGRSCHDCGERIALRFNAYKSRRGCAADGAAIKHAKRDEEFIFADLDDPKERVIAQLDSEDSPARSRGLGRRGTAGAKQKCRPGNGGA